eukprot:gene15710-21266_t
MGVENSQLLSDLPPEPQYPYTLLLNCDPVTGVQSLSSKVTDTINKHIGEPKSKTNASDNNLLMDNNNDKNDNNDDNKDSENKINDNSDLNVINPIIINESISTINNENNNVTFPSPHLNKTIFELLNSTSHKILVGFGKNNFGRFSVAAILDEETGELRCEKKYLLSKFSSKRGRRSHVESVLSTSSAAQLLEGVNLNPSSFYNNSNNDQSQSNLNDGNDLDESSENVTKHYMTKSSTNRVRSVPANYNLDDYDHGHDDYTLTNDSEPNSGGKRKRNSNSSYSGQKVKALESISENTSIQNPKTSSNSSSSSLFLSRSIEHDDPNSDFKDAFLNVDTGEIYEGGWSYGMRHGKGICVFPDGLMYEGYWHGDKEQGYGVLMTGDRQVIYTGDWFEGQMHGGGTYNFPNGDKYIGDWKESVRHGRGDYLFSNGCRYSGDWKDNKRAGRGIFVWSDTSFYDGEWEGDVRHGRGQLELACGFKFEGMWAANCMEGKGACTFPAGQVYQGTYKNGLREGRGSIKFSEVAIYEGRFKEDRFDGQGTIKISGTVPGSEEEEIMIPIQ